MLFTLGSSSVPSLKSFGHDVRWLGLLVLLVAALVAAWRTGVAPAGAAVALVAALGVFELVLFLASAAWSVDPRLTLERGVTFAAVAVAAGALATATRGRPQAARAFLWAIVAGVAAVTAAGFVLYLVRPDEASLAASVSSPFRFRGLGENPNTVSLLGGVATPVVLWAVGDSRRRLSLATAAATLVLVYAAIVLSGSRGAMVAAIGGALVYAASRPRRRMAVLAAATIAASAVGVAAAQVPQPLSQAAAPGATTTTATTPSTTTSGVGGRGSRGPGTRRKPPPGTATTPSTTTSGVGGRGSRGPGTRRKPPPGTATTPSTTTSGVGGRGSRGPGTRRKPPPPPSAVSTKIFRNRALGRIAEESGADTNRRTLLGTSGRGEAWIGAIRQGNEQPLLGHGFGTEDVVFIDRYSGFEGDRPENSLIGLYLQVGLIGLGAFVLLVLTLLGAGARSLVRAGGRERAVAGACLGVMVGGGLLMLVQSYAYSAGNLAVLTLWTCALLLLAVPTWKSGPA